MNSPVMTVQESVGKQERPPNSVISETRSIPLESTGPKTTESMIIKSKNGSSDGLPEIAVSVPYDSPVIQVQLSSGQESDSILYSEIPITQAAESNQADAETKQKVIPGQPQMLIGVQQPTHTHFGIGLHSLNHYYSGPASEQREQLSLTPKPDIQSDLKAEVTQIILPGPPPLPADLLLKIMESKKDAGMVPTGVAEAHRSIVGIGEPKNPVLGFETKQMPSYLVDDDGDLPEFDFNAACGISKSPASKRSWYTHGPLIKEQQTPCLQEVGSSTLTTNLHRYRL